MKSFEVQISSQDDTVQRLCSSYWTRNGEGKFVKPVRDLAAEYGTSIQGVLDVVRLNSRAVDLSSACEQCGVLTNFFSSREHTRQSFGYRNSGKHLCDACQAKEREEQAQKDAIRRQARQEEMAAAVENGVYESLSPLEFNLLVSLLEVGGSLEAFKKVGIDSRRGTNLFAKLRDYRLLDYDDKAWWPAPGLREVLAGVSFRRKVKSIFGSPLAIEAYRKLKRTHGFVFPEIPICSFVERSAVSHLFTEGWHSSYFLTCRVDFVVADENGKPIFCVEFQGGYHRSQEQEIKDRFKSDVLSIVGIPLNQWSAKDIQTE